jgi:aspartate/methionine/tyrosine aminotransferase
MELLDCRFNPDQTGLFLWGRIPENILECETFVEDILQKAHVFLTPGFIFGSRGERFVRISLCATEERLEEARKRIEKLKL